MPVLHELNNSDGLHPWQVNTLQRLNDMAMRWNTSVMTTVTKATLPNRSNRFITRDCLSRRKREKHQWRVIGRVNDRSSMTADSFDTLFRSRSTSTHMEQSVLSLLIAHTNRSGFTRSDRKAEEERKQVTIEILSMRRKAMQWRESFLSFASM